MAKMVPCPKGYTVVKDRPVPPLNSLGCYIPLFFFSSSSFFSFIVLPPPPPPPPHSKLVPTPLPPHLPLVKFWFCHCCISLAHPTLPYFSKSYFHLPAILSPLFFSLHSLSHLGSKQVPHTPMLPLRS